MTIPRFRTNQAATGSALLLSGQIFSKGFFALSAMLLSRTLDDASFGAIALFISIGPVVMFFVDSGYSLVLNRRLSLAPGELGKLLPPAMGTRMMLSLFSLAISIPAALLLGLGTERITVLVIVLLAFSLEAISEVCFAVFRAFQKAGFESGSRVLGGLAGLLFIVLVVLRSPGAGLAALSYLTRSALMAGICLLLLSRFGVRKPPVFSPGPAMETLKENRHIWAMGMLLICAQRLDSVVLRVFLSEEAVGAYQECFRIVDTLTLIITPTLLPGSLFPKLCRAFAEGEGEARRLLSKIGSLVTGLALLVMPPIMIGGRDFLEALWGPGFLRGQAPDSFGTCFMLCGASIPAVFWMNFLLASTLAAGRQRTALRAAAAGLILSLAANLLLVPGMGLTGSALALLISNYVLVLVLVLGHTRIERTGFYHELWRVLPGAAAAAAVFFAGRRLPSIPLGILVGAAFAAGWLPFGGFSLLRRKDEGPLPEGTAPNGPCEHR
jgi:O-antigen/teichoic acid export membrane protein